MAKFAKPERQKTQSDLVAEDGGRKAETITEMVTIPDVARLHTKTRAEIAEAIVTVLKSRPNITRLVFEVGRGFELTYTHRP